MSCPDGIKKEVLALALGELPAGRALETERHLAGCRECAALRLAVLGERAALGGGAMPLLAAGPAFSGAAARAAAAGVGVDFAAGRAQTLPFPDRRFDVVVAVTVLCFVPDAEAAFREIARVLRPGGAVVIGELGRWNLWALRRRIRGWLGNRLWRAARFHTADELRRLAAGAGLEARAVRGAVFYPPVAALACAMAPLDPWLGRITAIGAAFVALRAEKPAEAACASPAPSP